jgi:hypothetical protein
VISLNISEYKNRERRALLLQKAKALQKADDTTGCRFAFLVSLV